MRTDHKSVSCSRRPIPGSNESDTGARISSMMVVGVAEGCFILLEA